MGIKFLTVTTALGLALLSGVAHADSIVTKQLDLGTLAVPSSTAYSTVFAPGAVAAADTFYEDYRFVVPDASFATLSATLSLGDVLNISNLQARLYTGDLSTATVGAVLSPQELLQRWSSAVASGGTGALTVIDPIALGAGSYILEIRGQVTGSAGGAYVGLINVSAVPEPQTWLMLAAGLLVLGTTAARRARG